MSRKKFCLVKMYYCDFFSKRKAFNLRVCWNKPFITGLGPNPIEHLVRTGRPHCLLQPYSCDILLISYYSLINSFNKWYSQWSFVNYSLSKYCLSQTCHMTCVMYNLFKKNLYIFGTKQRKGEREIKPVRWTICTCAQQGKICHSMRRLSNKEYSLELLSDNVLPFTICQVVCYPLTA